MLKKSISFELFTIGGLKNNLEVSYEIKESDNRDVIIELFEQKKMVYGANCKQLVLEEANKMLDVPKFFVFENEKEVSKEMLIVFVMAQEKSRLKAEQEKQKAEQEKQKAVQEKQQAEQKLERLSQGLVGDFQLVKRKGKSLSIKTTLSPNKEFVFHPERFPKNVPIKFPRKKPNLSIGIDEGEMEEMRFTEFTPENRSLSFE